MNKILTDCDGVLLNWEKSFHEWMTQNEHELQEGYQSTYKIGEMYGISNNSAHKLIREFNQSAWMCCLPVLRDAQEGVAHLVKNGFTFDVITSLSSDPFAAKLRTQNLEQVFTSEPWDKLICLDCGADKHDALAEYKDSNLFWIEDKPENCDAGLAAGLRPILIDHIHNRWYNNPEVVRVKSWQEIIQIVT